MKDMIIWKDVGVAIHHKCWHVHKNRGILHRDFVNDYGDVPVGVVVGGVGSVNSKTGEWMPPRCLTVVNPRGRAYAARKRLMYRKGYNRAKSRRQVI